LGIVHDLVAEASGSTASVPAMLRKLKVIAARTATTDLAEWVDHELTGYPEGLPLPPYRGPFNGPVLGTISNPARWEQNMTLPRLAFPEPIRKHDELFSLSFTQSVAELEVMAASTKAYRAPWPGDVVARVQYYIDRGEAGFDSYATLHEVYRPIPPAAVRGILDTVQSRILDLALSLEHLAPTAGELGSPVVSEQVSHQFHTHIHGPSTNVAIGSTNVQQNAALPPRGDEPALLQAMSTAGVTVDDVQELRTALARDRDENNGVDPTEPGQHVSRWWSRLSLKAGSVTGKVGVAAAGGLAARALAAYFGIA
jgi:hypothetical protein